MKYIVGTDEGQGSKIQTCDDDIMKQVCVYRTCLILKCQILCLNVVCVISQLLLFFYLRNFFKKLFSSESSRKWIKKF